MADLNPNPRLPSTYLPPPPLEIPHWSRRPRKKHKSVVVASVNPHQKVTCSHGH